MSISVTEFRAKCLAVLERIRKTGESIIVTKWGKPLVKVIPARSARAATPQDKLLGSVKILGDIIEPIIPAAIWEAGAARGGGNTALRRASRKVRGSQKGLKNRR